jgi:hypothetical protein
MLITKFTNHKTGGVSMYRSKIYVNEILNKMNQIFERFAYLSRSKTFKKEQINQIDYHINEIMKILNDCN